VYLFYYVVTPGYYPNPIAYPNNYQISQFTTWVLERTRLKLGQNQQKYMTLTSINLFFDTPIDFDCLRLT